MPADCLAPWSVFLNFFRAHQCSEIYSAQLSNTGFFPVTEYLPYLLMTLALEFPVYYMFLRKQLNWLKTAKADFVLNIATHPFIFYVLPLLMPRASYLTYILTSQALATFVGILILSRYYRIGALRAMSAVVAANLFSWTISSFL